MFVAPPRVTAEVVARLPDTFRQHAQPVVRFGVARDCFLEGPAFDAHGRLYMVDIPYGRIFRMDPSGAFTLVARYDGLPNGLKVMPDGSLLVTDHVRGLLRIDPENGAVETVLAVAHGEPFKGLNDLFIARGGEIYFTDQGASGINEPRGAVYCLNLDGRLMRLLDNVPSPNGIVCSPDERILYVAVTRSNQIWSVPLTQFEPGVIRRAGVFQNLSGGTGPDGLAMSARGALCVAHIGLGVVWVFDPRGEPVLRIDAPTGPGVTNLAFHPQDPDSLYITESASGHVLRASLKGVV